MLNRRQPPSEIVRLANSPVQRVLRLLEQLFAAAPQPRVPTRSARACGELLGTYVLNLASACGELNLSGLHSAAVTFFRPLEDALDCLAAVTLVAGAADRWLVDDLKPSDAAKLWVGRASIKPITGETFGEYRRRLRSTFNPLAHCAPVVAHWDAFLDSERTDSTFCQLRINHERYVIVSNAHRVDAFLVAHCWEILAVVESAYANYFETHPDVNADLRATKEDYCRLLEEHFRLQLLESVQPPEIEHRLARPTRADQASSLYEHWNGTWFCGDKGPTRGILTLRERGPALTATLTTQGRAGDSVHSVTEEFSGVRAGDRVLLDGTSAEITPVANDVVFMLDSFELAIMAEGTEMKGRHSCRLGDGEAVFRRV